MSIWQSGGSPLGNKNKVLNYEYQDAQQAVWQHRRHQPAPEAISQDGYQ